MAFPSCFFSIKRSIGELLPDDAAQRTVGALYGINAERDLLIVVEVKPAQKPLQVLLIKYKIVPLPPVRPLVKEERIEISGRLLKHLV